LSGRSGRTRARHTRRTRGAVRRRGPRSWCSRIARRALRPPTSRGLSTGSVARIHRTFEGVPIMPDIAPEQLADAASRFAALVGRGDNATACIPWRGSIHASGWPRIWVGGARGRSWSAAQLSWLFAGRRLPPGGRLFRICATRWCVNPNHLNTTRPLKLRALKRTGRIALGGKGRT
jgi:hypothetical protein